MGYAASLSMPVNFYRLRSEMSIYSRQTVVAAAARVGLQQSDRNAPPVEEIVSG